MKRTREELGQEMDGHVQQAQAITTKAEVEDRDLTQGESEQFDGHMAAARTLKSRIERAAQLEVEQNFLVSSPTPSIIRNQPLQTSDSAAPPVFAQPADYSSLKAFRDLGATPQESRRIAVIAGMWARARIFGDAHARQWLVDNAWGETKMRAMEVGSPIAGGTLVPDEFERAIIDLRKTYGVARRECRVIPMGADSLTIPRMVGNTTVYFPGEGGSITDSDRGTDAVTLSAKKAAVLTKISSELAEDSVIDVAEMLAQDMAWAFAKKEDECLVDGDGSATYGNMIGIRTKMVDGNHTGSYVDATAADDQWGEYVIDDFHSLQGTLPDFADANAKWYCHKICWNQTMMRLAAASGGVTMAELLMGMRGENRFLGDPVVLMNAMPSASTAYNELVVLFYGDMRQAVTFGDRRGLRIEVLRERYAEYDQLGIKATERFDIVAHDLVDVSDSTAPGALLGMRGNTS